MPDPHSPDPELTAERDHLAHSRATLHRMREAAESLHSKRIQGGNEVSSQILAESLWRRMRSLEDDPEVPLFFGRLDYDRTLGAELDERLYVGRRHVVGEAGGEPLVIDWRAVMALPFYRARPGEPMGVRLRRRFGFDHGELTALEDEELTTPHGDEHSGILESEIERPRTGPMRDIVATIQPEQDVLVRTELGRSLCIQGAPGTGKTAVGLHRAAYLLYSFRNQLSRSGVLVVGPNDSFLGYIGDVLPALGEIDARSETLESLLEKETGHPVRAEDPAEVAVLKGDPRLAEVLHRAIWGRLREPTSTLVVPRGAHQWRVPAYRAEEAMAALRARGVRYQAGRELLPIRLAHQVLLRMEAAGDSPDDRVQNAVAKSRPVKAYCAEIWPEVKADQLVLRLLTDAEFRAEACTGILTEDEQSLLQLGKPARTPKSAKFSLADLVLIDEARDLLERTGSLGHVIVDEAQDLSPMQLRAVGRRVSTGSVTVLGDLAQATTPWASRSWPESLRHLGKADAELTELVAGFRVPGAVIDYAARLLPTIAPGLTPPHSVRRGRGELELRAVDPLGGLPGAVGELDEREGTIGVILPDALVRDARRVLEDAGITYQLLGADDGFVSHVQLAPASLAKGLEFDHVVLLEPAGIVAGEADRRTGLRRLYVCLTRAVTSLIVLHAEDLPTELGTAPVMAGSSPSS
ncbi:AAA family ATPase [Enemella evansiae]|uniref:HelD family protein n=1 Tax=Enemella evansiae TaxID=2016499 RepID=UPI000B95FCC7|nr:AAA family ATPase [Enemella evansiae]OYO04871.1 AAA family ATPase [Enemella evansiae]